MGASQQQDHLVSVGYWTKFVYWLSFYHQLTNQYVVHWLTWWDALTKLVLLELRGDKQTVWLGHARGTPVCSVNPIIKLWALAFWWHTGWRQAGILRNLAIPWSEFFTKRNCFKRKLLSERKVLLSEQILCPKSIYFALWANFLLACRARIVMRSEAAPGCSRERYW